MVTSGGGQSDFTLRKTSEPRAFFHIRRSRRDRLKHGAEQIADRSGLSAAVLGCDGKRADARQRLGDGPTQSCRMPDKEVGRRVGVKPPMPSPGKSK